MIAFIDYDHGIGFEWFKEKSIRRKKPGIKTYFPQGRILHATLSREADRWFVSLTVEEEILGPIAPRDWGIFRARLEAKAKFRGVRIVKVNPFAPRSKICSIYGHALLELLLSVRAWTCPICGTHHDRDENAAKFYFALL